MLTSGGSQHSSYARGSGGYRATAHRSHTPEHLNSASREQAVRHTYQKDAAGHSSEHAQHAYHQTRDNAKAQQIKAQQASRWRADAGDAGATVSGSAKVQGGKFAPVQYAPVEQAAESSQQQQQLVESSEKAHTSQHYAKYGW